MSLSLSSQCELLHWADVLDIFDEILEKSSQNESSPWIKPCDMPGREKEKELLLQVAIGHVGGIAIRALKNAFPG